MDYRFRYRIACYCADPGPFVIDVVNGKVVSAREENSGELVSQQVLEGLPTVDDVFDSIAEAIAHEPYSFAVEYDVTLGFPVQVDADWAEGLADDEYTKVLSDFQLL